MVLRYDSQQQLGNVLAWRFVDDETGSGILIDNPLQAARLGAPTLGQSAAPAPGSAPSPVPPPGGQPLPPPAPVGPLRPSPAPAPGAPVPLPPPPSAYMPSVPATPRGPDLRLARFDGADASAAAAVGDTDRQVLDAPSSNGFRRGAPLPKAPEPIESVNPMMSVPDPEDPGTTGSASEGSPRQQFAIQPPRNPQEIAKERAQVALELAGGVPVMERTGGRAGTPAHMQIDKTTTRGDPDVTGALAHAVMQNAEYQQDTATMATTEQRRQLSDEMNRQNERLADAQEKQVKLADLAKQQQNEKASRMARLNTRRAEVASLKVNPNRFWDDADAGTTLLASISMALGAFGSSMNGGPNQVMQIINDYIERDTRRQEDAIGSAKEGVAVEENAFQEWLNEGNDPEQTRLTLRALKLEHAETIAARIATTNAFAGSEVQLREVLARIEKEKLATLAELEKSLGVSIEQKYVPEVKAIAAGHRLRDRDDVVREIEGDQKLADIAGGTRPGGKGLTEDERVMKAGEALISKEGVAMADVEAAWSRWEETVQTMREKYNGDIPGMGTVSSAFPEAVLGQDARIVREAAKAVAQANLRRETGAAATEEEKADKERAIARMGDPLTSTEEIINQAVAGRKQFNQSMAARFAPFGGIEVYRAYMRNLRSIPVDGGMLDPNSASHIDFIPDNPNASRD